MCCAASLIVVDLARTELAVMADHHLQLVPGTNVLLLNSLAAVIVTEGLVAREFVTQRVAGFAELAAFLAGATPEASAAITGVPAGAVRAAARAYAGRRRPMMLRTPPRRDRAVPGQRGGDAACNLALLVGVGARARRNCCAARTTRRELPTWVASPELPGLVRA
ncbi:MAG: molybdopterin-dependent oxidoreductase [Planctomycetota bacterium]